MNELKQILHTVIFKTDNTTVYLTDIILVIAIISFTIFALKTVKKLFESYTEKNKINANPFWSIYLIVKYFIWIIVIILCLETVGVNISVLLASVTALLVGVGLGIQQLFNDIASGIIILIERSLMMNDVIQLQDGTFGKVYSIGIRTSKLKTNDGIIIIVPNSKFVNKDIINWSHMSSKTRFHIDIGVEYGVDIPKLKEILIQTALKHNSVSKYPYPQVQLREFADFSLNFKLFFWTPKAFEIEAISSDIRLDIVERFRQENINIPFPIQDITIHKKP